MIAEATSTGLRTYRIVLAAIFLGSLAVAFFILPGQSERVAMLERDGHSREALTILEDLFNAGDRRYNTLLQMQELYEQEGDLPKARRFLEQMVAERPRDPALRKRLARFYRDTHDEAAYLAALKAQIEMRYSEQACRELAGALRLKGDYAAEQAALQMCRQKGYRRPDDLSRLADLYAAGGDAAQAATLLRSIDDLRRLNTTRERFQLLTLLVELDQPKEAERRCLRWIRSTKDDGLAIGLIEILARSKYPDAAIEVAKDAGAPGDSISLTVAERLIERSQPGPARLYLKGWFDNATASDETTLLRFIDAALTAGDPATALAGARKLGLVRLPAGLGHRLAVDLSISGESAAASQVAAAIGEAAPRSAGGNAGGDGKAGEASAGPLTPVGQEQPVLSDAAPPGSLRQKGKEAALRDPLDGWRKSLFSKMSDDAVRRLQASTFGPPVPDSLSGRGRSSSLKLFRKTSRVLQRANRNKLLKSRRAQHKDRARPHGKP